MNTTRHDHINRLVFLSLKNTGENFGLSIAYSKFYLLEFFFLFPFFFFVAIGWMFYVAFPLFKIESKLKKDCVSNILITKYCCFFFIDIYFFSFLVYTWT